MSVHDFNERLEALGRRVERTTVDGGGGGGDDGGMEAKIAKLEAEVEHLRTDTKELKDDVREIRRDVSGIRTTDFRLIMGALIAVALGLAGIMARGFHWL